MSEKPLFSNTPLVDAVRAIENSRRRTAVVVGDDGRLLGTLTDGDIRRCLLAGGTLQTPVSQAMNHAPLIAEIGSPASYLLDLMRRGNVITVPLVDQEGRFQHLVHRTDLDEGEVECSSASRFAFAVIMAGGEGTRLKPLTKKIPKPMVNIGGVPLLERQIQRLALAGLKRVYVSVNYLSHIIEEHFGNGSRFNIEIRYLFEQEKLGTAGALALLPEKPKGPILVMNGDILTTSDFGCLYSFHEDHATDITVAAVDYQVNIPYGVLRAEGSFVTEFEEKPSQRFLCNAGIYAVSPQSLELLPHVRHYNMTEFIEMCLAHNLPIAVFPIHEYWSDIGTHDDLAKARAIFC